MARIVYFAVAVACIFSLASAEQAIVKSVIPSFIYPVEHRAADLKALQEQAALQGYQLELVPESNEQDKQPVFESDPAEVSLLDLAWNLLPSPLVALKSVVKTIFSKFWQLAKFLMPLNLILLGVGLVVGLCAFTSYCTLLIEEPIASKIRAVTSSIPYLDDMEHYVNDAIYRVHNLQDYYYY